MTLSELLKPSRNKDESFAAYKIRRCVANETIHERKTGNVFYASWAILHGKRWPYRSQSSD